MTRRTVLASLPLAACLALSAAAQSTVWTVDVAGGADFDDLPAAVAAAAPGDVILVGDGQYGGSPLPFPTGTPVDVGAKGLTLVAEGAAGLSRVEIGAVPAGASAVLRGFASKQLALNVTDAAGVVWLEEHDFAHPVESFGDRNSVIANGADALVVLRSELWGGVGAAPPPALVANDSGVHLYDALVRGGTSIIHLTGFGAPGLDATDSFAFASGTAFVHGPHNPGLGGEPEPPDALQDGPTAASVVVDTTGEFELAGGVQQAIGGAARSFEATALAREGEDVTFTWTGEPGDFAILNVSTQPGALFFDAFTGSAVIQAPLLLLKPAGLVPASGVRTLSLPVPELGAGVEGVVIFSQGSFAELSVPQIRLGGGSATVLLDASL